MLIDTNRTAAAICPECSTAVISSISAFSFSGGRAVKVLCPTKGCRNECFTLLRKNGKIKVTVSCAFCGDIHTFTADEGKIWQKDFVTFSCPESGIGVFFLGTRKKVNDALEGTLFRLDEIYSEVIDELSGDEFEEFGEDDDLLYDILDELHLMRQKGELSCVCGSEALSVSVLGGKVLISCPRCRRSKILSVDEQTLAMILNASAIVLGK